MTNRDKFGSDQLILTFTLLHGEFGSGSELDVCTVAILYEDDPTRDLAIRVCERLVKSFYRDLEFDFTWWKFKYLVEPEIAYQAADAAAKADLILVSVRQTQSFPLEVMAWFERWLAARKSSEGALVSVHELPEPKRQPARQDEYLRLVAKRAHLDYLSLSNSNLAQQSSDGGQPKIAVLPAAISEGMGKDHHYSTGWGIND